MYLKIPEAGGGRLGVRGSRREERSGEREVLWRPVLGRGPGFPVHRVLKMFLGVSTFVQGQLCHLWDPVQGPLVEKLLRILRGQRAIHPRGVPVVNTQVAHPGGLPLLPP